MSNVVPFKKPAAKKDSPRKSNTLCRQGHHKWDVIKENRFDVKEGKLVTGYRCRYCHKLKTSAH
jgi:hypothetical protein